ncbi:IclR family transcriptional regulator [Leisingera daeponensis]|uniref:IclR family transcriptional regulator n=1 Tax=Leisingera daeponensis TaxID=405746 RepID=UPI001C980ED8|nr:IclR family transcriptional regulator [Leisingera daeponensis]MBY6058597.1 IclR family transcriptional regulator [Leisingera daeponensis]
MTAEPQSDTGPKPRRTIRAAVHVVEILRCLSRSRPPLGINEIARRTGLDKSSISRLVATLEEERMVERLPDSSKFRLGLGVVALSARLVTSLKLTTLVRPKLEELAQELSETVSLSIWDGNEAVSVTQALGPNAITHFAAPGQRNPAHCTASGKVLLAACPDVEIEEFLARPLKSYTDMTITNPDALRRELKDIRQNGYAANNGEFEPDVAATAVIVRGERDRPFGALTVTAPIYRFDSKRQQDSVAVLKVAADFLSEDIQSRQDT